MEPIERYIQGTIHTNGCNLSCQYCYLRLQHNHAQGAKFCYSMNHMRRAMSTKRWGRCFISLTGDGETLMDPAVVTLASTLLDLGHCLNIINNGTQTENLRRMATTFTPSQAERTMLTFSLHYNELKRRNLLPQYFSNIRMMKAAGFTIYIHLVLADEYIPEADEIREVCEKELGILPQLGIVRDEHTDAHRELYTSYSPDTYFAVADTFHSPYFDLQHLLYQKGQVTEYCHAGDKGVLLDFSTGVMRQCLCNYKGCNVFNEPDEPIRFQPVGSECGAPWCFCAPFQILGMIKGWDLPSYRDIYAGPWRNFVSDELLNALSVKLAEGGESDGPDEAGSKA